MHRDRTPKDRTNIPANHPTGPRRCLRLHRWFPVFALFLIRLLLLPSAAFPQQGQTRYVNNADPACQGHSPCYQTIQTAVDAAQAGDTIRIQAGSYQEQVNISGKNNVAGATEADRIIIEADPTAPLGNVILQGAISQCTNGYAIRLQQSKFITIRGFTITGAGGQAISLMGGNNQNQAIHIERNRIFGNGSPECNGGITIARGNPDTLIVNNLIYANGRNGITFIDADGGPHYLINNTIPGNQWSGVSVARSHEVFLVNNLITGNGTASGSTGGRFGIKREDSTSPQPEGIHLLHNLLCGNRLGEINGPALDSSDANNLTPTGSEGPGVSASPGCEVLATVFANLNGPDGQPNTADDAFTLATGSPAIDRGMDPRTLGLDPNFTALFEADFTGEAKRPKDGNGSGTPEFDLGAFEFVSAARPTITALNPSSAVHGRTITLTVTGERLTGTTALTFLKDGTPDATITASNLQSNAQGTELTATITLAANAPLGSRVVTVTTPEGTSDAAPTSGNTFTVLGQLTLVPDFVTLVEGQTGGLTVQLSAPAPTGGLTVTLESASTTIATVPASVTIAAGASSAPTSVTAVFEGTTNVTATATGFAVGQTVVTVRAPVPAITGFTPSSGKGGITVTLTGTGFRPSPSANSVSFTGTAGRVPASATAATGTSLTATVPSGAVTGPLQVTTSGGTATSTGYFIFLPTQDFSLTLEPSTITAIAGISVNLKVSTVTTGGYTGLMTLSTGTLPPGVTATFTPLALGPNAAGLLTLTTSGTTPSSSVIEVRGIASIEATAITRTATATLNVQAVGQTVLVGQVLDENEKPIPGVSIKLGGSTLTTLGTTDAAGNFLVPLAVAGPQVFLIDGSTANTSAASYPTVPVTVSVQAGVVNTLGYTPHLMAHPRGKTIPILAGQDTILAPAEIPALAVQLPAGIIITGWDGQPNTEIGVVAVPVDRSGAPPIPAGQFSRTIYAYTFGKVGGGIPSQPVPITYPNDIDALPGEPVDLYYFDEAPDGSRPNAWAKYGTGTVSADGTTILPDPDPTTGKAYGVPRFCCGYNRPSRVPTSDRLRGPYGDQGGDPVELSTGAFVVTKTDLVLPGRLPLMVTRTYRAGVTSLGPFGIGTSWDADRFLVPPPNASADFLQLILAGGYYIPFARQPDGTFQNRQDPAYRGAQVSLEPGLRVLRFNDGATWRFRTSDGLLVSQTDRTGNTIGLTRDSQGRVTALSEPAGRQLTVSYAGSSLRIDRITDPLGREVRYTYDAQGRLETVTDPAGGVTRYTYDSNHRLLTITDPRGITFLTNEYDSANRVIRQTQADGGVWTFAYTSAGGSITATTVTDPRGHRTLSRFNADRYLVSRTDALGQTTTFDRQPGTNLLLSTTDPLGRVTRFEYDASGNVTSITDPQGNVRTFTYDPVFNKVTSITDPLGNITRFEYDPANGNLLKITDPLGAVTQMAYNSFGQPVSTTDAVGRTTTFTYDSVGNLTGLTDPLGHTTQRSYDTVSRLMAQSGPLGKTTRFSYDALNRLVSLVDALGGGTNFSYDPNGNLLTVTDARGNTITHEYDSMDRLSRRIDPLGKTETFTYDGNGNLVSTTDRKLQTTTSTYDPLNRRIQTTYADGTVAVFTYDAGGRLIQADDTADPHRPITLEYDPLDRLLAETTALGTVSYQYDALGRRIQMTVSGHAPVTYSYDASSRLRTITQAPLNPVDIQYDALGRRTLLSLPNGVSTEYIYDLGSRLSALVYRNAFGLLGDLTYQYDAAGNRIGVGGSFARPLFPDSVPSASYDSANRQVTFGDKTTTFDDNGNLATLTQAPGTTTVTWDTRNRLTALAGATTGTFAYDAQGRRVTKTINGITTTFHYDSADIVQQLDPFGTTRYLRSLIIDEALSFTNRDGVYFSIYDPLGSTLAITDSGATPIVEYTYEPFGRTSSTNPTFPNPFQYTSRENDSTGLYYYRARYYSPSFQRFLTEDPIGSAGGLNFYSYTGNNPLASSDPLGLYTGSVCIKGSAGFGVGGGGGTCINLGYDRKQGFTISLSGTAGGGGFAGIGGAIGASFMFSNAPTVFDLTGGAISLAAGGGAGAVVGLGGSVSFPRPIKAVEGFIAAGLMLGTGITTPFAVEGFINTTSTIVGFGTRSGFVGPSQ